MKGEGGRHGGETPTVDLGIGGQRVPVHSHLAVIWETDEDLRELLGFVTAGLRGEDHCVLVGDRGDHERTLPILKQEGVDIERLMAESRLVVITREPSAQATLSSVTSAFEAAVSAGAPLIRLFGNVGWGRDSGPTDAELFRFEAGLAAVAERFPCIMLCLHPMDALGGAIARNGVLRIHSRLLDEGRIVDSPLFVPPERLAQRIESIASALSRRQGERESGRYLSEILQAIFDNIPVMISFMDASGRFQLVNREWERRLGWSLAEAQQTDLISRLHPDPDRRRSVEEFIRRAEGRWEDFLITTRGGETLETSWFRIALSDGTSIGLGLDVSERQRTEERLNQSAAELRALSERLRVAREEERTSMAREVHDEIGQALTALQMDVDWLEHKVGVLDGEPSGLGAKLRSMSRLIGATLGAVQRIAAELRPGVLDELGLEAAIEWYLTEFQPRTGVVCRFRSELEGPPLDSGRSTAVFRILQEALTNVARHSVATQARIHLSSDRDRLRLEIRDNGRGIPADRIEDSASLGLIGMRERARALGGEVQIRGNPGRGTTVTLTIPR